MDVVSSSEDEKSALANISKTPARLEQMAKDKDRRRKKRVFRRQRLEVVREEPVYYVYSTLVDIRTEEIPPFVKVPKRKKAIAR